jgi:hypothetical protein
MEQMLMYETVLKQDSKYTSYTQGTFSKAGFKNLYVFLSNDILAKVTVKQTSKGNNEQTKETNQRSRVQSDWKPIS